MWKSVSYQSISTPLDNGSALWSVSLSKKIGPNQGLFLYR